LLVFFVKHHISEINFFSGITKKIVKFLSCAFVFCILLILTNYLVSNAIIWVIYIVLAVSSNNGAGKNGTGGKVGKIGTFLILRFWVEGFGMRGGVWGWGFKIWGFGKFTTSLLFLLPFHLCHYYLFHFYRCHFYLKSVLAD